jgi:hypothetical protein
MLAKQVRNAASVNKNTGLFFLKKEKKKFWCTRISYAPF